MNIICKKFQNKKLMLGSLDTFQFHDSTILITECELAVFKRSKSQTEQFSKILIYQFFKAEIWKEKAVKFNL